MTLTPRPLVHAVLLALLAPLVAVLLVTTSPPADAAWTQLTRIHDARLHACKVRQRHGWRIKLRINNRGGEHTHLGRIYRHRNGDYVTLQVRARAGRISKVKGINWRRGDAMDSGVFDTSGVGGGGGFHPSELERCRA